MKLHLSELRAVIREAVNDCWGGSHPDETYDQTIDEDEVYKKKSVLVPDDIKHSIAKWAKAMGLSGRKKG